MCSKRGEKLEWVKGMSEEIKRLEKKEDEGEELTFSELYFLHTIEILVNIFKPN